MMSTKKRGGLNATSYSTVATVANSELRLHAETIDKNMLTAKALQKEKAVVVK